MANLRKIDQIEITENNEMRARIEELVTDVRISRIMLKDIHLIEAAVQTDRVVASLDEIARGHFARVSASFDEIDRIVWVNPTRESERLESWLRRGAPENRSRQLGYRRR